MRWALRACVYGVHHTLTCEHAKIDRSGQTLSSMVVEHAGPRCTCTGRTTSPVLSYRERRRRGSSLGEHSLAVVQARRARGVQGNGCTSRGRRVTTRRYSRRTASLRGHSASSGEQRRANYEQRRASDEQRRGSGTDAPGFTFTLFTSSGRTVASQGTNSEETGSRKRRTRNELLGRTHTRAAMARGARGRNMHDEESRTKAPRSTSRRLLVLSRGNERHRTRNERANTRPGPRLTPN